MNLHRHLLTLNSQLQEGKTLKRLLILALASFLAGIYLGLPSGPARAAETWGVPVTGSAGCPNASGWYVNPDEAALAPVQKPGGFLFDGASLVHHEVGGLDLADVHAGTFTGEVKTGSAPLFKMETSNPYTTINVTADGKFWATAMLASDPGGQSHPVEHAADLIGLTTKPGKPQLTDATQVVTFGVGYGTDTGNTATVSSVSFHGHVYDLSCQPVQTTSPSPSASSSHTTSPSASASHSTTTKPSVSHTPAAPGVAVTTTPASGGLPVTGPSVGLIAAIAAGLIAGGCALFIAARRRKVDFEG